MLFVIMTGGTFDKQYPRRSGAREFEFGDSAVPLIIEKIEARVDFGFRQPFQLDSQDITHEYRLQLVELCREIDEPHIVIVHGTDTMIDTANFLAAQHLKVTIVLTGSRLPYSDRNTDAEFNLGFACCAAQIMRRGVYIAMHARVFGWDEVTRNAEGQFVEKPAEKL